MPEENLALPVTGMTCANCAAAVERALSKKVPGVVRAMVNFATESAHVVAVSVPTPALHVSPSSARSATGGSSSGFPTQSPIIRFRAMYRSRGSGDRTDRESPPVNEMPVPNS